MTDTADYADYVLPATTQLEHWDVHTSYGHTDVLLNRAGDRAARRGAPQHPDLSRAGARAWASTSPASPTTTRRCARSAFAPGAIDFDELRAHGWVKLPLPDAPFADGGFPTPIGRCDSSTRPAIGVPDHVPNYETALRARRSSRSAIRWR